MSLKISLSHQDHASDALESSVIEILEENKLCSMATIKDGDQSYINTAFFCFNNHLDFFILTDPKSQHSQNLEQNKSVALTIYDSRQSWDEDMKGLQFTGECELAKGMKLIEGTALYLKRFAGLKELISHPDDFVKGAIKTRIYIVRTNWLQLFDTERFGDDTFIPISF